MNGVRLTGRLGVKIDSIEVHLFHTAVIADSTYGEPAMSLTGFTTAFIEASKFLG